MMMHAWRTHKIVLNCLLASIFINEVLEAVLDEKSSSDHLSFTSSPSSSSSSSSSSISPAMITKDACHNELFQATCPPRHVIVVTSAHHGRMFKGNCVKANFGFLGCYNDVTGHVNRRCSGRQSCSIRMPDHVMERSKPPCNDDLINYLQVNFTCVQVTMEADNCLIQLGMHNQPIYLVHSSANHQKQHVEIAAQHSLHPQQPPYQHFSQQQQPYNNQNNNERQNSDPCSEAWYITAEAGQRISVELYDFSLVKALLPANQSTISRKHKQKQKHYRQHYYPQQQAQRHYASYQSFDPYSPPESYSSSSYFSSPFSSLPIMASRCIVSVADIYEVELENPLHLNNHEIKSEDYPPSPPSSSFPSSSSSTKMSFPPTPPHPSYTLCGSDLDAINAEMTALLRNKTTQMRLLVTWVQAYETSGNGMKVQLLPRKWSEAVYVIKIAATGCIKFDPGKDSEKVVVVTQLKQSLLRLECVETGRMVYVACVGNKWNGSVETCYAVNSAYVLQKDSINSYFKWGPATFGGLVLIWSLAILLLFIGLYYLRRRRRLMVKKQDDIGLKDMKPLNSQEALYGSNNHDIYAKNQAFDPSSNSTNVSLSSKDTVCVASAVARFSNKCHSNNSSPLKSGNIFNGTPSKTNTLPSSLPSAVSVLVTKKPSSILAGKTRPSAIEFCTRVWQSPESHRRIDFPIPEMNFPSVQAPVMTFHPAVSESLENQNNLYLAHQNHHLRQNHLQEEQSTQQLPFYTNQQQLKVLQKGQQPSNLHQPQMLGLRAVWIDNYTNNGYSRSYQNAIVNETYSLPNKQGSISNSTRVNAAEIIHSNNKKSRNLIVFSEYNEYQNEEAGYEEQRRLPPLPPIPSTMPLMSLAFRNATYHTWNNTDDTTTPYANHVDASMQLAGQPSDSINNICADGQFDYRSNGTSSEINDSINNAASSPENLFGSSSGSCGE